MLSDFRAENSFVPRRLDPEATWEMVENVVLRDGLSIIVTGKLRGPARLSTFSGNARLKLSSRSDSQQGVWLNVLRIRVAPWKLPRIRIKEIVTFNDSEDKLSARIQSLLLYVDTDVQKIVTDETTAASSNVHEYSLTKILEKAEWAKVVIGSIATAVKKALEKVPSVSIGVAERTNLVMNVAQDIADATRIVASVSSVFQLVALGARMFHLFGEANRGMVNSPQSYRKLVFYWDMFWKVRCRYLTQRECRNRYSRISYSMSWKAHWS